MKQIVVEPNGRPFNWDDMLTVQEELLAATQAQFLNKGAFIVSGCYVSGPATGATITAGIVLLNGQLLRFAGQSGVALPAELQAGAVVLSDPRPYESGGTKNCMREVPAVLVGVNTTTAGESILIDTWGGKRWEHVQLASVRSPQEVQWLARYNSDDYDDNGVGWPGTEAWGWALCDGRGGRLDLGGRVAVGRNPSRSDYDTVGKADGAEKVRLTAAQNGQHNHVPDGQFGYNQVLRKAPLNSNTTVKETDGSGNGGVEPDVTTTGTIQSSGSGEEHENRMPFTVLNARQWVGFKV